jgi:hypothetical protein
LRKRVTPVQLPRTRHHVSIAEGGISIGAPSNYRPSQLLRRFPVGATYVVEGVGAAEGHLRVIARSMVLLADGASTFPLCGSSAPFLLVIDLRERLPVGVLDDEACPAVHNVEGKSPNWGALAAHL